MRKKRSLTLLEITVAMVLLGFLLAVLFQIFQQGIKKNLAAVQLKQKVLEYELFHQRLKFIFSNQQKVWLGTHPNAKGQVLFVTFVERADPELLSEGSALGMLYVEDGRLNFAAWGKEGSWVETLLDNVTGFQCLLFQAKKGKWVDDWPHTENKSPAMAKVMVQKEKNDIPFVFFLADPSEAYAGPS